MKNWLKNFGLGVLIGLLAIFALVWLAYTVFILKSDPLLADAYVAVGTLILALVTSVLVGLTWLTIRNADQKEQRNRKERLLNEIIEWATEAAKSAIYRQEKESHELWKAILNYKYCISKSEYVNVIATSSFSTLSSLINDVVIKLNRVMGETTNYKDNKNRTDENHRLMRDCEDSLRKSVEELLKEAAKIKSGLLNNRLSKP